MGHRPWLLGLACLAALAGCTENPTPDVHPEVFKTVGEVAHERRAKYQEVWEQSALAILKSDRPDIDAQPLGAGRFGVVLQADGVRREVNLTPFMQSLSTQIGRSDIVLREALRPELLALDQQRLLAMDFDRVKSRLTPLLLSEAQLRQRSAEAGSGGLLHATSIAPGVEWLPAVQWAPLPDAITPITAPVLDHWHLAPNQADQVALANLAAGFRADCFQTTPFELLGRVGTIRPGVNPAVILLPQFLEAVRSAWGTSDDLAILATNPRDVRFVESGNRRLLDMLYPQWERSVQDSPDAIAAKVLLASPQGIRQMDYTPPVRIHAAASQPAKRPGAQIPDPLKNLKRPATRPYIVR